MIARALLGFALALTVALAARHRRLLTGDGAAAAVLLGTLGMIAGTRWAALLVTYFLAATAASRWRQREKARRTEGVVAKGGARDARQVIANGGVYALACLYGELSAAPLAIAAGLGALAASLADTWATEVGSAVSATPRLITTWARVEPGRSGAVSLAGSLAMIAGAVGVGMAALGFGLGNRVFLSALAGGLAGSLADSLLGALVQERRRCPACGQLTERRLHQHDAAVATAVIGGVRGFDNDWVNLTSTAIGAVVAAFLSRGGL
jgi:uncharacterized protein (TIGR00297 family)